MYNNRNLWLHPSILLFVLPEKFGFKWEEIDVVPQKLFLGFKLAVFWNHRKATVPRTLCPFLGNRKQYFTVVREDWVWWVTFEESVLLNDCKNTTLRCRIFSVEDLVNFFCHCHYCYIYSISVTACYVNVLLLSDNFENPSYFSRGYQAEKSFSSWLTLKYEAAFPEGKVYC